MHRDLEKVDRKLRMDFGCQPEPEGRQDAISSDDGVQQLVHVVETEVTVVQQHPAAVLCRLLDEASSVHLLTLTHRDGAVLCTTIIIQNCVFNTSSTGVRLIAGVKGPTLSSPMIDEERTRPGHRLGSVPRVSLSDLTLLVG